jgi:hypothetical protein
MAGTAKKDFNSINTERYYDSIMHAAEETQDEHETQEAQEILTGQRAPRKDRKTYTEQEAFELLQQAKTQGRKGVKLPRIMVAFEPDVFFYIKVMSRVTAMTQSEIVNIAMHEYMKNHADTFEKVLEFRESL